ncbi:hypothetical protein CDD82_6522 [Ophiocordyceps australis]|uniref:C2H2-type domain-containing protein n=1 Tax=Ophiocordyceps australis TaxID=1399860 RepID=A0A2C5ZR28_9HYPO|nr:hypothetical protein CDD82_6522 [Ophiocordyceps australis]
MDDLVASSTITVNTRAPATFPPPKTDKPRPHICQTCQRSFARLEHLKRHERSHTKEKPFECPECARCFARRDLLLRHQQKLHQSSAPASRPRNRRESASGAASGHSRARKNSIVGNNPDGSNMPPNSMRPRANTIGNAEGAAMQLIASANSSVARGLSIHSRHPSLGGFGMSVHPLEHYFGGTALSGHVNQRAVPHDFTRLEAGQIGSGHDYEQGLRTGPSMPVYSPEIDVDGIFFGPGSTVNPNALHYSDSPQSMALDQASTSFGHNMADLPSHSQPFDDSLDWLTGFEQQMSFQTASENVIDGSSPSAISTASPGGISELMLDGSNGPQPAGTGSSWPVSGLAHHSVHNAFPVDLGGPVFTDLLNGAPLSPQPASSQKMNDPYFSTPPPSLSSLSPSVVSGLNAQNLNQAIGFSAGPETPSSLGGANHVGSSTVTTISDATRTAIVNTLSQCLPFGGRKYSFTSQSSPLSSSGSCNTTSTGQQLTNVPSTQDLQRYVNAYLSYFHPHLPFLHIPTLNFDLSCPLSGRLSGVGGIGCLVLSMAAIGALYELEPVPARELFEMAKKMVMLIIEEMKRNDGRRSDVRRSTACGETTDTTSLQTPVWLVQAMLLGAVYGHNCDDKTANDIASNQSASLMSLAQAADMLKPSVPSNESSVLGETAMSEETAWGRMSEQEEQHNEWVQWKRGEERKRTLYAIFIMSSLLVATYNHQPVLTNSEVLLDLPCDEDFYSAESSSAFVAKGGVQGANANRLTFYDALGELLRTSQRQKKRFLAKDEGQVHESPRGKDDEAPLTDLRPSTFGCLILINALHNYMWETRQRHDSKVWTDDETEQLQRHMEPALKAWQVAWASNPKHSVERPNPFCVSPLSADAIPLLDLAYVRLFVNLARSKDKFCQRDWEGMAEELAEGSGHADDAADMADGLDTSAVLFDDSAAQSPSLQGVADSNMSRREKYLRKAAFYAADSLAMSDRLGVTFADFTSRELPLQSALCAFDCAQVLAEWIATLQDRVGRYLGILGQDSSDLSKMPAIMLLEEEDVKLLGKVDEILRSARLKLSGATGPDAMKGIESTGKGADAGGGYAVRILELTASMLDRAVVWPITQLMARCLKQQASYARSRGQKSCLCPD